MEFILKYNPCDSVPEYLRSGAFPRFHKARTLLQFINLVGVPQRYVHRHNPPSKKLIPTLQLDDQRISISSTFQCLKKFESSSLFLIYAFTLPYLNGLNQIITGEKRGLYGAYSLSIQTYKYVCIERLSSPATNKTPYFNVVFIFCT